MNPDEDPNTAADLFADDIMRIVMSRLAVQLLAMANNGIAVEVVDMKTGQRAGMGGVLTLDIVAPQPTLVARR